MYGGRRFGFVCPCLENDKDPPVLTLGGVGDARKGGLFWRIHRPLLTGESIADGSSNPVNSLRITTENICSDFGAFKKYGIAKNSNALKNMRRFYG